MWAYRGQLPAIQDKRNQILPALLWQQVKEQSLIQANNFNCYTQTEIYGLQHEQAEWEKRLDYRD